MAGQKDWSFAPFDQPVFALGRFVLVREAIPHSAQGAIRWPRCVTSRRPASGAFHPVRRLCSRLCMHQTLRYIRDMPRTSNPDFLNGLPQLTILQLLTRRSMYGYQLVLALREQSAETLSFGEGCV